ncbi:amidohydrolase [Philodulcilactobacillus myokoensis]|uniref:Amidohydrolase n=1 Tax=Philodulcilactobacillus myokoensis TaxID=2929573 RepID=A0A9W6B1G7_9LACO|nr:amidohydrolase family protein [Philodulcilactobacillus myokoensis]GLB46379.1 amidohydrolase [Philodulcilactobacillus myokoensis]
MTKVLFNNFSLFNGKDNQLKSNAWLLADRKTGKIVSVGSGDEPKADQYMDLNGKFVMPGLINVHTHITFDPYSSTGNTDVDEVQSTVRAVKHLHELLKSGVTTIRECGATYDIDIVLEKLREAGQLKHVPTIMPSGRPYGITGGHSDLPNWGYHCDSVDAMRHDVRVGIKKGAKAIKVMATGGVMTKQDSMYDPQLSAEDMRTAVVEAHHKGLIAMAHAEANPGIANAIKAGVDSIEHCFEVNDDEIDSMLKKHIFLTATLQTAWAMKHYGKGKLPQWEMNKIDACWKMLTKNIKHAWHRGVPVVVGTDAGCPFAYFDTTAKEFELMAKYMDVTNYEALLANYHSAELLERNQQFDPKVGVLAPDYHADFLVLDHNPLDDIKAPQQEDKVVYKGGIKEV